MGCETSDGVGSTAPGVACKKSGQPKSSLHPKIGARGATSKISSRDGGYVSVYDRDTVRFLLSDMKDMGNKK